MDKELRDHEFGSQSTELKLSIVEGYLKAFTIALRQHYPKLWYFDAFAGTGVRTVRIQAKHGTLFEEPAGEHVERRRGSAQIALGVSPAFDRLVFFDKKRRHVQALNALRSENPDRDIHVVEGDATAELSGGFRTVDWQSTRAVIFLDPYGMDVEWETLVAIAATRSIDLWYLFPLSGLYRQAARRIDSVDDNKRSAITRMLGTDKWLTELYSGSGQEEMFTESTISQRTADVRGLENYVRSRLSEIFPSVLPPLALPVGRGPQMFSLFFAVSNPNPAAIGLATRIASSLLQNVRGIRARR